MIRGCAFCAWASPGAHASAASASAGVTTEKPHSTFDRLTAIVNLTPNSGQPYAPASDILLRLPGR